MRSWRLGICCLLSLLLSGCGFHLRHAPVLPEHLRVIYLNTSAPYSTFTRTLKETLHHSSARLVDCPTQSTIGLYIIKSTMSYDTPTISNSSTARVYRYTFAVDYQLKSRHANDIGPIHHIIASRFTTLNSGILTETNNQVYVLQLALYEDVSRQILQRMSAKCWSQ